MRLLLLIAAALLLPAAYGQVYQDCSGRNLTVQSCSVYEDRVKVRFHSTMPSRPEQLSYRFSTSQGTTLHYGTSVSPDIADVGLKAIRGSEYELTFWTSQTLAVVHLSDPQCTQATYKSASADCPLSAAAFPLEGTVCGNLPSVQARVRCRLYVIEPPQLDTPEECRVLAPTSRAGCVTFHRELLPCLGDDTAESLRCARSVIAPGDIAAEAAACNVSGAASCLPALRDKAYRMTRFRLLLLRHQARSLLSRGVTEELVVDFISNLEVRMQAFNSVSTAAEKVNIITQVKQLWEEFLYNAEPQVLQHEGRQP